MEKKIEETSTNFSIVSHGNETAISVAPGNVKDEKPYDPFEHRNLPHPNSTAGTIAHMIKASIGSGILAMPAAFKNAGVIPGAFGSVLAGLICTHSLAMLVRTSEGVCIQSRVPSMSFAETCGAAFKHGPKRLRSWEHFVKIFIDYSVSLTYLSVLCVYVVFIGSSFKEVLDALFPQIQLSIQIYCVLTLVPLVLICQIRSLKYLVPFSATANALILVVIVIALFYIFNELPPLSERVMVATISQWPLFFCTSIFAMHSIGVIMPVRNEMEKPQQFLGCPGVLNVSMAVIATLHGVFGFLGYWHYGEEIKGSITLNLPESTILAQAAKLMMAVVIYFSYPLQMYVPMEMITRKLSERQSQKYYNFLQVTSRTLLVTVSVAVAAAFPNLELVISFTGAIFFSTLGILTPAVIETVFLWDRNLGPCNYIVFKNILIGIIAIITLVFGAYKSVEGIVDEFFADHSTDVDSFTNDNFTMISYTPSA